VAKNDPAAETANTETNAATEAAPATTDSRSVILTIPADHVSRPHLALGDGENTVKRQDYIKKLWASKQFTRGEIAKQLTELQGKPVPYQIVFQATKGLDGGKPKEAAPAAEPAEA